MNLLQQELLVKVKKLHPKAVVPQYMTAGAAAVDLYATEVKLEQLYVEYKTGLAFEIPEGHVGLIYPRSSISSQTTLMLSNCVGVIDSDYVGEITFRFRPLYPDGNKIYKVGERIGQLMIQQIPRMNIIEVSELKDTDRGAGGYGSTGSK